MKNILRILCLCCVIFSASLGYASTLIPKVDPNGVTYIQLDGRIEENDPWLFVRALNNSRARNVKVWGVFLNSSGGSVDAGLQLASVIRQYGLSTYVGSNSTCVSACFYLFAAGVQRWAAVDSRVGVHSAAENGLETERATSATIRFSRVLAKLDVPDDILGKIVKTPPKDVYVLSPQDLAAMKVQFYPTPARQIQNILAEEGFSKPQGVEAKLDRQRARALNEAGLNAIKTGQIDGALSAFTDATTLYPFDAEILGNLGYAQYLKGQYQVALSTLHAALKVRPDRVKTFQNIGLVYAELGNIGMAAKYLVAYFKSFENSKVAISRMNSWILDDSMPMRAQATALALQLYKQ